jgi:PAS domain S-box-containing protein
MQQEMKNYQDLVESELFTMGPIVVFIWENKENWPVYSVSKNIDRLYGYTAQSFIDAKLQYAHIIHSDDITRVFEEVAEASLVPTTRSFTHEPYRLKCADGVYTWVQDTTIILRENEEILYYVGYISDISELKDLEQQNQKTRDELLTNEAFLKSYKVAMDSSSMVSISNLAGEITYANEQFCKVSGYTQEEVLGKQHNILRHPSTQKETFIKLWETIQAKNIWKGKLQNRGKFVDYWVDIAVIPILDASGEIVEYIAVRHDITQMKKQKEVLNSAANTDLITGFGNRYKLYNDIQKSVSPALAILNIDRFSQINDFYGHEKGDFVIKSLGDNIYDIIKDKNCKLYHLQGDEYVIFAPDTCRDSFLDNITILLPEISKNKAIIIYEE